MSRDPHAPFALISKVKAGDTLVTDDGFTCMGRDHHKTVRADKNGSLFIYCRDGEHHLIGQIDGDRYVGLFAYQDSPSETDEAS